jgi:hypothetical protein
LEPGEPEQLALSHVLLDAKEIAVSIFLFEMLRGYKDSWKDGQYSKESSKAHLLSR